MPKPLKTFIIYAREDAVFKNELLRQLAPFAQLGLLEKWDDSHILPGEEWEKSIEKALEASQIVLMLVSADSLFSDFIQRKELKKALEQKREGATRVVPILVSDCLHDMAEGISGLQMLPLHPVSRSLTAVDDVAIWGSRASAWAAALRQLRDVIADVHARVEAEEKGRLQEEEKLVALAAEQEAQAQHDRDLRSRAKLLRTKDEAAWKAAIHDLMIPIKGGTFKFGGNQSVTLQDFHLCKYPVTQAQWKKIMGDNPSRFKGDDLPVEKASWDDTQAFLIKLNERLPTGQKPYRLPSEAEWEYAAKGGNQSKGFEYAGSNDLKEVGWYWENSGDKPLTGEWKPDVITANNCKTHAVGQKKPNELGLYDMSGNVWEWCQDLWHEDYKGAPNDGSAWEQGGDSTRRVVRGGSWFNYPYYCRAAYRNRFDPDLRPTFVGFRLAR